MKDFGKISRRNFLKTTVSSTAGLLTGSVLGQSVINKTLCDGSGRKPNVIFMITDDQELDSFGFINRKALTPNIDRLASEGVYFSRAYATSSVCTPSRYTCLTGRYASRSKVDKFTNGITKEGQTWVHWNTDLAVIEDNVAKVLKANGYETGIVGKLHGFELAGHDKSLNRKSDAKNPEVIRALKADQEKFARGLKEHGFDDAAHLHRGNLGSGKSLPLELCQHAPEWTAQAAVEFIQQNKDKPFYLYYATTLLHGPDPLTSLKSDPRISEEGYLKEVPDVMPSRQSVLQRCKKAGIPESLAPATWLDDSIGAIMKKLDELDLTKDTLVIYFNDHGAENGKGSLYEGGVRTPTIIRYPAKVKPRQCDELIGNIDFVPTIFGAADVIASNEMTMDGLDLMPLLTGRTNETRDSVYCEIGYTRAVITKDWKYLAFRVPPSRQVSREENLEAMKKAAKKSKKPALKINPEGKVTHIHRTPGGDGTELGNGLKRYKENYFDADQLYNLKNDPGETTNLVNNPEYKQQLEMMKAELGKHLKAIPGTFAEFKVTQQ